MNGSKRQLVVVPSISTRESVRKLVPPKIKEFMTRLVPYSRCLRCSKKEKVSVDVITKAEEKKMSYWLINYFCETELSTFVDVANDNGYAFGRKKMTAEFAAAMLSKANIGATASRAVNKYLTSFFGHRIMPPEDDIYRGSWLATSFPLI